MKSWIAMFVGVLLGWASASLVVMRPVEAQSKPFNVYTTPTACVFVAGDVNPAIAVIPRQEMHKVAIRNGELYVETVGVCE